MRAYKYLDQKWGLEDITEFHVKVSQFADMNDPFELIGSRWSDSNVEDLLAAHCESEYSAMCLSRDCTNPLLWAHYADKHRGLCLGFDIPDDPNAVNQVILVAGREMQDPEVLVSAIKARAPETAVNSAMRKLLVKHEGWRYEDEVRIITRSSVQYFKFDDDDFVLKQVILGARSGLSKRTILNRLQDYNHYVEILKAKLSEDTFQILAEPAADCEDGVGAVHGPEHARPFQPGTYHRLAAGFDDARANEQVLASKLGIAHPFRIPLEVVRGRPQISVTLAADRW